jgi:phosphoribosyl 1,2-cyclic phosphodiesterase
VTHTHWDHIQGLPFFAPLFVPNCNVRFFGTFDPVYDKSLRDILAGQMEYCYYPVRESELKANIEYTSLKDGETADLGDAKVTAVLMNHPVLNFGYLIEADGKKAFFTGDHEPLLNIYDPNDPEYDEYEALISLRNDDIERWLKGVDLLITDSMYTAEEYPSKRGWGHGSHESCIDMARRVQAGRLVLTHHDPVRTDDELDAIEKRLRDWSGAEGLDFVIAREGMTVEVR